MAEEKKVLTLDEFEQRLMTTRPGEGEFARGQD